MDYESAVSNHLGITLATLDSNLRSSSPPNCYVKSEWKRKNKDVVHEALDGDLVKITAPLHLLTHIADEDFVALKIFTDYYCIKYVEVQSELG